MRNRITGVAVALAAAAVLVGGGTAVADDGADGASIGSSGFAGGDEVQVPVHTPVSLCGESIDTVGLSNPAFGKVCQSLSSPTSGW
ncbi:chaplin [Streptomyces griseoviridis]